MKVLFSRVLFLLLFTPLVVVGEGTGTHGGGAFVCSDGSRNELLDLWEATHILKLKPVRSHRPANEQLNDFVSRLKIYSPVFGKKVEKEVLNLSKRILDSQEMELMPPPDAENTYKKPGCELEGVALYHDDESILDYDEKKAKSLPLTDQAALDFHEGVYKALRGLAPQADSKWARAIVGYVVFDALKPVTEGIPRTGFNLCEIHPYYSVESYAWTEGDKVYVQFTQVYNNKEEKEDMWPLVFGRLRGSFTDKVMAERLRRAGRPLPPSDDGAYRRVDFKFEDSVLFPGFKIYAFSHGYKENGHVRFAFASYHLAPGSKIDGILGGGECGLMQGLPPAVL